MTEPKKRRINPPVSCVYCHTVVGVTRLPNHQLTPVCRIAQQRHEIEANWTNYFYVNIPDEDKCIDLYYGNKYNVKRMPTSYRHAGWGRKGQVRTTLMMRRIYAKILTCTALSPTERLSMADVPPSDPKFQELLMLAELASLGTEKT